MLVKDGATTKAIYTTTQNLANFMRIFTNKASLIKDFDNELKKHLCIALIDTLIFDSNSTNDDNKIKLLKIFGKTT